MVRNSILVLMIISIMLLALGTGCAALSERQKLAGSAMAFSAAVDQVDALKRAGKLSDGEVKLLVAGLKGAERGLDEWRAALDAYELRVDAALRATIKRAVADVLLEAARARLRP